MRAAVIARPGPPDVLEIRDVPRPEPGTEQVLVRVRASALNRADLIQRAGRYPAPPGWPADIPGLELAGEVSQSGPGARRWREGDRVFGLVGGGAHAEYVVMHERTLAPVPAGMDWTDAGAVPEAFITAHDALVARAHVRPGDQVLVHAVGSGVGLAAVQVARALGATPYGTARTPDKLERARELGMTDGVTLADGSLDALTGAVATWTNGGGIDIVLDLVGGAYTAASIGIMAPLGRLVLIGTMGGARTDLDLRQVLTRRLTIRGTVMRARPLEERILTMRAFEREVVPLLARGIVRPVIDRVFPLGEIAEAHRYLESNASFGKVGIAVG